jgi:hypothetical protein
MGRRSAFRFWVNAWTLVGFAIAVIVGAGIGLLSQHLPQG